MSVFDRLTTTRAISMITSAPGSEDPAVSHAVDKLKQIGTPTVPKLIEALAGRGDRAAVIQDLLATMLSDESLPLFRQALYNEKVEIVERVADVLERRGRYDPNQLLTLFLDPEAPKSVLARILAAHGSSIDSRAVLRLVDDVAADVRPALLRVLHQTAGEQLVPTILTRLADADPPVRQELLRTLGRFAIPEVEAALIEHLDDDHKGVRLTALEMLASDRFETPIEPLMAVLRDPDMIIQSRALDVLVESDRHELVEQAIILLDDRDERVRRAAVEILNRRPEPKAIQPLVATLQDEDWWFRERAADALAEIGGLPVLHALMTRFVEDDPDLHETLIALIRRLVASDGLSQKDLHQFLTHRSAPVRRGAIRAVGAFGDAAAVPILVPMLDAESEEKRDVIAALAALADPGAVRPLLAELEMCRQEETQRAILDALEEVTDRSNAPFVIEQVRRIGLRMADESLTTSAQRTISSLCFRFDQEVPADEPVSVSASPPPPSLSLSLEAAPPTPDAPPSLVVEAGADGLPRRDTQVDLSTAARDEINPLALRAGDRLADRYRVIRQIGRGGFGVVVLVEDEIITEQMILKFLAPHVAQDEIVVHRFKHEIRYARRITHENVIRIHDLISFGSTLAISMEYFASHSLVAELHRFKRIPVGRGRDILAAVSRGLGVAHREGVIHRDLKPGNILIDDDLEVKIVDFGLAAAASQGASRLTRSGLVIGTPIYMAPEQIEGGPIDGRTDIYSLGVLMYEMFTGHVPFEGENAMATLFKHLHGKAELPRSRNPEIPEALEAVILRAMARTPDQRFQDTDALLAALEGLDL